MNVDEGGDRPRQTQRWFRFTSGPRCGVTLVVLALGTSCVDAVSAISDAPVPYDAKVAQATEAFAARFTSPERSGRFETARRRLVRGALSPSRAFSDTSIWSESATSATRSLLARGGLTDHGYRFEVASDRALLKPGDARHLITLRRLTDSEFRWNASVDFAIGSLTANDVAGLFNELWSSGHGHDAASLRTDAVAAFPRSSEVLSRIFTIDSLTMHPSAQGTTMIDLTLGIRAEGLRATAPHFADYIRKYVSTSRYRFALTDASGVPFLEIHGANQQLKVQYRVKAGTIVSSLGPPRALSDSMRLTTDLLMHVKMFDVGWRNLVTDFVIRRSEHDVSWTMTGQTEPDWQLPLITERLLRTPLRRPFQGEGASFQIGVSDSAGTQSALYRSGKLEMKESAVLRFLGGLVTRVFEDLDASVEREEAAYVRELMVAFRQDAHVRPRPGRAESKNAADR
jgi:hypothetical protein